MEEQILDLIRNDKYTELVKILEDNIISDTGFKDPKIFRYYSYALFKSGNILAAIKSIENILKYNSENILFNHQLAFLYYTDKKYIKALEYVDRAVELLNNTDNPEMLEILSLKAIIYEYLDKTKAVNTYQLIIDKFEDNPGSYERLANLLLTKFKSSKNLNNINFNESLYNKATQTLRKGDIDKAILLYKDVIRQDKHCYPAYLGISQALYEKDFGLREINKSTNCSEISKLFKNYNQLNDLEKNIINTSIAPFENFIDKLCKNNSSFIIVPIDVKITDFPENKYLANKNYLGDVPYNTLRGLGGKNAYVGIERLRDFLWEIPESMKFLPACISHEFAHQIWCLLDKDITSYIGKLYSETQITGDFISKYSSVNTEEYFAEYFAYYARKVSSGIKILNNNDPMIQVINDLRNY